MIAAPAPDQTCHHAGREYQCGKVARATLWDLVAGRDVVCEPVPDAEGSKPMTWRSSPIAAWAAPASARAWSSRAGARRSAGLRQYAGVEEAAKQAGSGLWSGQFDLPWGAGEGDHDP